MDPSVDTRVTLWNTNTKRKIAGKAAPMEKNLQDYLQKHPECELYNGQDKLLTPDEKRQLIAAQNRIAIWNTEKQKRISGNAAPTEKKLAEYLRKHPECEVYNGQDKAGYRPSQPVHVPKAQASAPIGIRNSARQQQASIADQYGLGARDDWNQQLAMGNSMDARPMSIGKDNLEEMLMGMSIDEDFGSFGGSIEMGGSLQEFFGDLQRGGDPLAREVGSVGSGAGMEVPMSPAQRIKRDRASSSAGLGGQGSLPGQGYMISGSLNPQPHQRLRGGPAPGSLPPGGAFEDSPYTNPAAKSDCGSLGDAWAV